MGHEARVEETHSPKCLLTCKPDAGKRSVCSQKRQWNDVIGDLKKCKMYPNWREQAQDRSIWCGWIKAAAEDLNEELELIKKSKKHQLKQRREAVNQEQTLSDWRCSAREHLELTKQAW